MLSLRRKCQTEQTFLGEYGIFAQSASGIWWKLTCGRRPTVLESSCQGSRFVIAHNKPESEDMPLGKRSDSVMSGLSWCQPTEVVKLRSELDWKGEHAASQQGGPCIIAAGAKTTRKNKVQKPPVYGFQRSAMGILAQSSSRSIREIVERCHVHRHAQKNAKVAQEFCNILSVGIDSGSAYGLAKLQALHKPL